MIVPAGHSRATEPIVAKNHDFAPKPLSCHSTTQRETIMQMTNIQDSDPLASYASYLRELYSSISHSHTSQHWTHLLSCEFIQLAMIGNGGLRRGDREEEMVRLAQQGRIETILDHKKLIDLDSLFPIPPKPLVLLPPPPRPRVLLIEGAPGGGKSTLALHLCHKWAQDDFSFGRFDLAILVYLRDQAIQNATTLADILPARTLEMSQMAASQMQSSCGANILFILDGWGEFPHHLQIKSLVSIIIRQPHKLSLHQSTVLITSRPVSSGNLLHLADRRVEIMGFTQHQIREYIEKALNGNSTHIQKLVQHLEEHPVIEGYCYVPLHVAILVHIFLTMKGALPTTLHELFCNLVLCCIVRELDTHESQSDTSEVCSLDDLPDDLRSKLSDLRVLAYEGVMQNKVVFYRNDLRQFNLPANLLSLGLLQVVEGLTLLSKSLSYNFLHLSVQELLAAYHISHFDSSKQLEVFERMFGGSRFQAVLQYYSGFTKLANPAIQDFISLYSKQQSSIKALLPLLHCFYEAQEPALCQLVDPRLIPNEQKILNAKDITPVDIRVIHYFLNCLGLLPTSTATHWIQDSVSNDDAMKSLMVTVTMEITNIGTQGYPGVGKTSVLKLAMGEKPALMRNSTDCVDPPLRHMMIESKTSEGVKWENVTTSRMFQMICEAMRKTIDENPPDIPELSEPASTTAVSLSTSDTSEHVTSVATKLISALIRHLIYLLLKSFLNHLLILLMFLFLILLACLFPTLLLIYAILILSLNCFLTCLMSYPAA